VKCGRNGGEVGDVSEGSRVECVCVCVCVCVREREREREREDLLKNRDEVV
jgi:hypothetical protein